MSDSMMDRVATAIATAETQWENSAKLDSGWGWENQERNKIRFIARAAIEAMREPTPKMIEMGHLRDPLACDVPEDEIEYCYGSMWRGMIDAALEP